MTSLPRAAVAALPARYLDDCHRELDALLPGRFGKASSVLEVDLATITALTHLAGVINRVDYTREGLTLQAIGLAGKSGGELLESVG